MKQYIVLALCILTSTSAFQAPIFATRAIAPKKAAPVKKVVAKKAVKKVVPKKAVKKVVPKKAPAKKVAPKKVAPKKAAVKKVVPKKAAVKKVTPKKVTPKKAVPKKVASTQSRTPPASRGYPSFAEQASKVKFPIAGPNRAPPVIFKVPDFSDPRLQIKRDPEFYAKAAKTRVSAFTGPKEYVYEDGLTVLERTQRSTLPSFLTGSAKSQADLSTIRSDISTDNLIFGLDPDRFQLLFISIFGLFTLVGCLSGNLQL